MKLLARSIMNWICREGISDWQSAMRREFDELQSGHLAWALGCMRTLFIEELRLNGHFYLLVLLAQYFCFAIFVWVLWAMDPSKEIVRAFGPTGLLLSPLPAAILLGRLRPNKTHNIVLIGGFLSSMVIVGFSFDAPTLIWIASNNTLYNAPPLVGLIASVGVWQIGTAIGARQTRKPRIG